jgi:hypothetical protein
MDVSGDSRATKAASIQREMSILVFVATTVIGGFIEKLFKTKKPENIFQKISFHDNNQHLKFF